jgi:pseudouridine-5'-phosphate glycosidase
MKSLKDLLVISVEVANALRDGVAVVALESTIITHGMPYPQNLEMALNVEAIVRETGAVPATIAIMNGKMMVGLDYKELERLAREGHSAAKASRRDMAALLSQKKLAGTTVATTMQIAALAGIRVFATGGIGGVHRGAESTFDISADLSELARTPVAVVCAGAKSILDIPKTLETLETNGVPVVGYKTSQFPAFFIQASGYPVDHAFDSVDGIADVIALQATLGMDNGIIVANPIPDDHALDAQEIEAHIARAVKEADQQGVTRKNLTPFLLQRIFELTEGRSLKANIELVFNNARVASLLALAVAARFKA